jgi:hypothetical protein
MFTIDYVYVPLTGKAYVATDVCYSFEVIEFSSDMMQLKFTHRAFDMNRQVVTFSSDVIIPKQKITVATITDIDIFAGV